MPRTPRKRSVEEAAVPTNGIGVDGFAWRDATIRGDKFHLREIDGDTYEKILKLAIIPGTDGEKIDLNTQYKLMLAKSCTDPKMTVDQIGTMPFRKRRALLAEVVILHFGDEEEDEGEGKESSSEEDESSET